MLQKKEISKSFPWGWLNLEKGLSKLFESIYLDDQFK